MIINELQFLIRQPIVAVGGLFLIAFAYIFANGVSVDAVQPSSQLIIKLHGFVLLVLPIMTLVITNSLFLRDINSGMDGLIAAAPITHTQKWLYRWLSAVGVCFIAIFITDLMILSSFILQTNHLDGVVVLTLQTLFISQLPSILVLSTFSLFVCLVLIQRSTNVLNVTLILTAILGVIWIGYIVMSSTLGSPILAGSQINSPWFYEVMLWLDPYGLTAVFDNINRPNQHFGFTYFVNRACFTIFSLIWLYYLLRHPLRMFSRNPGKNTDKINTHDTKQSASKTITINKNATVFTTLVHTSLLSLLRTPTSIGLLVLWPFLCFSEIASGINYVEAMSRLLPTSVDALNRISSDIMPVFGAIIICFWSWQLCWREHTVRFAEIHASAKFNNQQLVLSHVVVITIMALLLISLATLASLSAEVFTNSNILLNHYVVMMTYQLLPLIVLGTLVVSVQHIIQNKMIAAFTIFLLIIIKFTPVTTAFGLTHTLWNIGGTPLQDPDLFWGYARSASVYWPYMTFWLLVSVSFVLIAITLSHRGTGISSSKRRLLTKRVSQPITAIPLLLSIVATTFVGLNLHFSLISEKPLTNSHKRELWKASYEKTYKKWATQAQPVIVNIESNVDLYPAEHRATFAISYRLKNKSSTNINKVLISQYGNHELPGIDASNYEKIELDETLKQAVIHLATPLTPGDEMTASFSFTYEQPRLWPAGGHQFIDPSISYLRAIPVLPVIGFQTTYQLRDPLLRKQHDLVALNLAKPSELTPDFFAKNVHAYQWANMRTVISTDPGQTALTQGQLISSSYNKNTDRNEFVYKTSKPIRVIPAWLSFPTSSLHNELFVDENIKTTETNKQVHINIVAPKGTELTDAYNANLTAIKHTLSWFSTHIAAYPAEQLTLVSLPEVGTTGYALPQIMFVSHRYAFRSIPNEQATFDQRYRRAVHETAHQWFGHQLGNGVIEDGSFLIEAMAKYVELVVIEKHYGKQTTQGLIDYERRRFELTERTNSLKPSAIIDETQPHHQYSRATLVFAKLRSELGDQAIISAIQQVWLQHQPPNRPAVALDFVSALKKVSSHEHQKLIEQLLMTNDLSIL